jgi:hypothetical protein
MSELINKYKNSKLYKIEPIIEHDEEDIYIGSTCQPYLSSRMNQHRQLYKINKNLCNVKILFDKYGIENCNIILLELVNVNSKEELLMREAHYIRTLQCVNKQIPLRTTKEYYEANKNKIKEYREANKDKMKEYREANKDKIALKKKEYNEVNKDEINEKQKKYNEANKEKIALKKKEYREANKEKIKEYREANKDKMKEYREANKDKIKKLKPI